MTGPQDVDVGSSRPARANGWGLTEALMGFAAGIVIAAVVTSVVASIVGYHDRAGVPMPVVVTAVDVTGLWVGLVGAAVVASRSNGSGRLATDFGFRIGGWKDLVGGAAVGVASQYLLVPAIYLPFEQIDRGLAHRLSTPANTETGAVHSVLPLLALLLFVSVGAPIVEELFFRGLLLRSLLGRVPTPAAVVITALLFALAHFEPLQFAGLAAFGVVLGVLAWWTGRLGPGIAAHAAFNTVAVLTVVHLR